MKLKNKLLPLVGISAVCATVAPIALTSCNGNGMVSLTDLYKPTVDALSKDKLYQAEAYQKYFTQSAAYPEIFQDDFYWSQSEINNKLNTNSTSEGKYVEEEIKKISKKSEIKQSSNSADTIGIETSGRLYSGLFNNYITKDNEKISNVSFKEYGTSTFGTFWTVSFDREIEWALDYEFTGESSDDYDYGDVMEEDLSDLKAAAYKSWSEINMEKVEDYEKSSSYESTTTPTKTSEQVVVSGKISYKNVPVMLAYDQTYSLWYTYLYLDEEVDFLNLTADECWEYLWDLGIDASIATKFYVTEEGTEERYGKTEQFYNSYVYDVEMYDADSQAIITALRGLDKTYGSGRFAALMDNTSEFAYSHYLFNIDSYNE